MHWNVPLLRVPEKGTVAVHDCLWLMSSNSGVNPKMLNEQVAVLTPAGESATTIVQTTDLEPPPTLIVFGLKSKLDSDGTTMSSGTEVTASVAAGVSDAMFPTWSMVVTADAQVPASAKCGIERTHENKPLFLVPDTGAAEAHEAVWSLSGAASWHAAKATPDLASVSVMLHVTFCAATETVTAVGDSENNVSAGATMSGSDVTVRSEGNPWSAGLMLALFPTASVAETPGRAAPLVTPAVQVPD